MDRTGSVCYADGCGAGLIDVVPETRYARNGDVHIAYQVFGEGEVTLVGLPGIVSNIELIWEDPESRRWLTGLASFVRWSTTTSAARGCQIATRAFRPSMTGSATSRRCSMRSVWIASRWAGSPRAGTTAAMFAATYPERVSHLALYCTFAHIDAAFGDASCRAGRELGHPGDLHRPVMAPSKVGDPDFLRWVNRYERQTMTPGGLLAGWRWIREMDLRPVLGSIQCPTLVVHRSGDRMVPVATAAISPSTSPARGWSSSRGTPTHPSGATPRRCLSLTEEFLTGHHSTTEAEREGARNRPVHRHRRFDRPRGGRRATGRGGRCSTATTGSPRAPSPSAADAW